MTLDEVQAVIDEITLGAYLYTNARWRVLTKGDGFLLQLVYSEPDSTIPGNTSPEDQHARKWYISAHATKSEIVRTAYKAVLTSLEHRLGEHFRYQGVAIYSPHYDVDALVELNRHTKLDQRPSLPKGKGL